MEGGIVAIRKFEIEATEYVVEAPSGAGTLVIRLPGGWHIRTEWEGRWLSSYRPLRSVP